MRDEWKSGVSGNQEISDSLWSQWIYRETDLANLTRIRVPRWLGTREGGGSERHALASREAGAAAIFLRSMDSQRHICISWITAEARVTPIKEESEISNSMSVGVITFDNQVQEERRITTLSSVLTESSGKSDTVNPIYESLSIAIIGSEYNQVERKMYCVQRWKVPCLRAKIRLPPARDKRVEPLHGYL